MQIKAVPGKIHEYAADAIIVYMSEGRIPRGVDEALGGLLTELNEAGDLTGKLGEVTVLYTRGAIPAKRVIVVGVGNVDKFSADVVRRAAALGVQKARSLKVKHAATVTLGTEIKLLDVTAAAQAVTEGALLGAYRYAAKKSTPAPDDLPETLDILVQEDSELSAAEQGVHIGETIAKGVILARDLVNTPPNVCTPDYLAQTAEKTAEETGLECQALIPKQIEALRMGALLAVSQASVHQPRFIILEYNADAKDLDTVVLVGKGVTFDTGGYSMKTFEGMADMKGDMAGGAAVIGAMRAIAELGLPLHVVGLVPTADNMIDGKGYRPSDVITASNGVTIEIISTDAEGRLLLADALVFAGRYNPSAVIDIATLTGGSSIALGGQASSLFTNNDALKETLLAAADATRERLWPMPLYEEFDKLIETPNADIKNSGGRYGSASIGAVFLQHFVSYPAWAHVDMAHLEFNAKDTPYVPDKSATGYGVRLMVEFVRRWSERSK